jgi:hypothetical protein
MKQDQFRDPPSLLLALGHHEDFQVRSALELCLTSESKHPRIVQLQTSPLKDEAFQFLIGESLITLPNLDAFCASYKFGYSNEQRCEGLHA